jgi:hypothetical protein
MGSCLCKNNKDIKKFSIKLPNGVKYIEYDNHLKTFIEKDNINDWLNDLYKDSNWKNWILYNDDIDKFFSNQTSKGHCKGIIAWNNTRISWLCHSVPDFPASFQGNQISPIDESKFIYGQSFQYIEFQYTYDMIYSIINQLNIMHANIFIKHFSDNYIFDFNHKKKETIHTLIINKNIIHIAKSPHYEIDIYEYIYQQYPYQWNIETWKRGHEIHSENTNIKDICFIQFKENEYKQSQDHSKWGVTQNKKKFICYTSQNKYYWIGDLNRMTSQFKRGGGGFICIDKHLTKALQNIIEKKT